MSDFLDQNVKLKKSKSIRWINSAAKKKKKRNKKSDFDLGCSFKGYSLKWTGDYWG